MNNAENIQFFRPRKFPFLQNEPKELLKTKGKPKKRTENEAKTNLAKLLKTIETPKSGAKTNRKTKRAMLLKIKDGQKANRKRTGKRFGSLWRLP